MLIVYVLAFGTTRLAVDGEHTMYFVQYTTRTAVESEHTMDAVYFTLSHSMLPMADTWDT